MCNIKTPSYMSIQIGNGWCDAGAPFNTADCGWDGGDCCDTTLPLYECLDPTSPSYGLSSSRGLYLPAPTNPMYSTAQAGRSVTIAGVTQSYNNFYEVTLIRGGMHHSFSPFLSIQDYSYCHTSSGC